jgi:ankyrin repeat protein
MEKSKVLKIFQKYGIDPQMALKLGEASPSTIKLRGEPALVYAIFHGMIEAVKYLSTIPETNFGFRADGQNLLHIAAQAPDHRTEMIALMVSKGVDLLERSSTGRSVLHYLLGNRYRLGSEDLKIIHSILNAGGDVYVVDDHKASLLHVLFERPDFQSMTVPDDFLNIIFGDGRMITKPRIDGVLLLQLAIRSRQPSPTIRMLFLTRRETLLY